MYIIKRNRPERGDGRNSQQNRASTRSKGLKHRTRLRLCCEFNNIQLIQIKLSEGLADAMRRRKTGRPQGFPMFIRIEKQGLG